MWNFFDIVKEFGLSINGIDQAPETPGYYLLFAEEGTFIYVGKCDDLRKRLAEHFGSGETNERIRGIARYAIWQPTPDVRAAEIAEGALYDEWIRQTGVPPFANKQKPPESKLSDEEIFWAKLRALLNVFKSLGTP